MAIFSDIKTALRARLAALSGLPDVAWDNVNYEPVTGTTYLQPTVLPAETFAATIGDTGKDNNSGIFQINVFTEAGEGAGAALALVDAIADHFKPVTELVYNGSTVRCVSVSQNAPITGGGWYMIPVDIRYLALTTKR